MTDLTCQQAEDLRLEQAGGDLSTEEAGALDAHLRACAGCSAFMLELDSLEADLVQLLHAQAAPRQPGRAAQRFLEELQQEPQRAESWWLQPGVMAAAAVLALAVGVGLLSRPASPPPAGLQLARGSQTSPWSAQEHLRPGDVLELAEGQAPESVSVPQADVEVRPSTRIRLDALQPRSFTLLEGSVACAVVPGSGQFLINTDLGVVSVVGTRFSVTRRGQTLEVSVRKGRVRVESRGGRKCVLDPGQEASVGRDGEITVRGSDQPQPPLSPPPSADQVGVLPRDGELPPLRDCAVQTRLTNGPERAVLQVEGTVPWLPDGTGVHINVTAAGWGTNRMRVAFINSVVREGHFQGAFTWPNRQLAPLVYRTEVELLVAEQSPALRKGLLHELGYDDQARVLLVQGEDTLGSDEERAELERDGLTQLGSLVERADAVLRAARDVAKLDPAGQRWHQDYEQVIQAVRAVSQDLRSFQLAYVVRPEGEAVVDLREGLMNAMTALKGMSDDPHRDPSQTIWAAENVAQRLRLELQARQH